MTRPIYLDANSTTPLHPRVREALADALSDFGNPSSIHQLGRRARERVETAREQVAGAFGVEPDEILFTSGGTEANNLLIHSALTEGRGWISSVEHDSLWQPWIDRLRDGGLRARDFELPVDATGGHLPIDLPPSESETDWVSLQWINNETGRFQPLAALVQSYQRLGYRVHSDGAQGFFRVPVSISELGLDAATITAHKSFGPLGIGALYLRRGALLDPILRGGPQERRVRPGTENLLGIVGIGELARLSGEEELWPRDQLKKKSELFREALSSIEGCFPTLPVDQTYPSVVHVTFDDLDADTLLWKLDMSGVCASSGSACSAGTGKPSRVLQAMGLPDRRIRGALRFSFTPWTTAEELNNAAKTLHTIVRQLRSQRASRA